MTKDIPGDEILRARLREARLAAGLKQSDLALALSEPQSFVSKYENGERRLTLIEVRRICEVLNVDFVEFVKRLEVDLR